MTKPVLQPPVERAQLGVRMEKRMVKVLKGLAEFNGVSLGQLLEKIVLHSFEPIPGEEGEMAASEGETGDLYVLVHLLPHQSFVRDGDDLMYVLMINYPQAALGGEVLVPTLEGETPLRLRPGTQPGETIRIKGKGMHRFRGYGKGDLLVR